VVVTSRRNGTTAWSYDEGATLETVAVLDIPAVDSAEIAVPVAIAAKARRVY
jgi:hypothetical protein